MAMQLDTAINLAERPLAPVTDAADPIYSVVLAYKAERVQIVQANDMIEEGLYALGMASKQTFLPKQVGVEPGNRGTQGVNALAVQILASDILGVGWSTDATRHACCIRARPGCTAIQDFTAALCTGNDMAACESGDIVAGGFACTHTNMALRNIAAGGPSAHPDMSVDGRFCLARLEQKDKRYAAAVRTGLTWTCLDWRVKVWYPDVIDILQAARNMGQTMARQEDEMQTLLRIHALAAEAQQRGGFDAVMWPTIKRSIVRTRPPCEEKLGSMMQFVIVRSGGIDGEHIRYLSSFFNNCVQPVFRKGVPASLYENLAAFPLHFLALALLETAWLCPDNKVVDKECVFITGSDIVALAKLFKQPEGKQRLEAADKLARMFRVAIKEAIGGTPCEWPNDVVAQLATHDAHIGRYVLNKQVGVHVWGSLQQVADAFAKALSAVLRPKTAESKLRGYLDVQEALATASSGAGLSNRRNCSAKAVAKAKAANGKAKAAAKATPGGNVGLYEVGAEGEITTAIGKLRAKGWDIGSTLLLSSPPANCTTDDVFHIASASDSGIALNVEGAGGQAKTVVLEPAAFLEAAKPVPSDRIVMQALWPAQRIALSKAFAEAAARSRVMFAMETLAARTCSSVGDLVSIKLRPQKDVIAKKDLKVGELILVPETSKVTVAEVADLKAGLEAGQSYEDKVYPLEVYLTGLPTSFEDKRVFLGRSAEVDAFSPFWFVQNAKTAEEANLVEVFYSVQLNGGCDPWPEVQAPSRLVKPGLLDNAASELRYKAFQEASALAPPAKAAAIGKDGETALVPASGKEGGEPALATPARAAPIGKGGSSKGEKAAAKAAKAAPVATPPAAKAAVSKSAPAASSSSAAASLDESLSPALASHRALVQSIQKHDGQGEIHERYVFLPVLVNAVPVKAGEALRMQPTKEASKEKDRAIPIKQTLKRARLI